jgi:outer membrane protein TolC
MRKNKIPLLILFLTLTTFAVAQKDKNILSADAVMDMVRNHHPVAKQAALLKDRAAAELQSARGGFDPVFDYEASRKTIDGKNYYYYSNPELQIPTAAAITVKAGTENNGGDLLSSENTKGRSGYIGLELPLGNGLLMDKRRAALQQARILQNLNEQERRNILNNLLLDAGIAYWQWAGAYRQYQIWNAFVENAGNRLRLVRNGFENGDRSVMDTVESFTQLQQYRLQQTEALQQLNNASIELSFFLWKPDNTALQIDNEMIPDTAKLLLNQPLPPLDELIGLSLQQHPQLRSAGYKLNSMETDQRLKFQSLLPYVNLKANILNKDYAFANSWDAAYLQNNYKWGIGVNMPLFLRQGRGEYKKAQIKVKESKLELMTKQLQTENKVRLYHNELAQLRQQLSLATDMMQNYRQLLRNEELKFSQGESSLFLVNSRETKLLEMMQKQVSLQVKSAMAIYKLNWAAGLLL